MNDQPATAPTARQGQDTPESLPAVVKHLRDEISVERELTRSAVISWERDAAAQAAEIASLTAQVEKLTAALMTARAFTLDEYGSEESSALDGEPVSRDAREVWSSIHEALGEDGAALENEAKEAGIARLTSKVEKMTEKTDGCTEKAMEHYRRVENAARVVGVEQCDTCGHWWDDREERFPAGMSEDAAPDCPVCYWEVAAQQQAAEIARLRSALEAIAEGAPTERPSCIDDDGLFEPDLAGNADDRATEAFIAERWRVAAIARAALAAAERQ